ncbi:hypothetical protein ABFS83_03G075600 [Erythranthe nasuta]
MRLLDRFRKIIMRFIFPGGLPTRGRGSPGRQPAAPRRSSCDRAAVDTPKTSCSSSSYNYYSSNSHYSEAIADCIEFFNKSSSSSASQDCASSSFAGRKSDDVIITWSK